MFTCLSQNEPKARKRHDCDGHTQIDACVGYSSIQHEYCLDKKPSCTGAIEVGQQYIRQNNVQDGELYSWKSCKECFDLICEHDIGVD